MIKPKRWQPGDKVALVSLSSGMLGEPEFLHKFHLGRERLERDFGLELVAMPNALRGEDYLYRHPEARAEDWMAAFADPAIKGVISAIGGDDTIRLLPYVDFRLMADNPKIFTGFSDTTSNHFVCRKAGLVSYYGPCLMCNFAEYGAINPYTLQSIRDSFFEPKAELPILSAPYWHDDEDEKLWWKEENLGRSIPYHPAEGGYELLQGEGIAEGELLGGCIDVFPELLGTSLWPSREEWRGKLLLVETSEADMSADNLCWLLRGLAAQGLFQVLSGVVVGRPARRSKAEPYKEVWRKVVGFEAGRPELPILFNVNVGHAEPIGVLPLNLRYRLDAQQKSLTLLEPAAE